MRTGFDHDLYTRMQSDNIRSRIAAFGGKLYLELGGKLFDDFHASRVLPGFKPDSKVSMLLNLKDQAELVVAINADDIEKSKVRGDLGISYDADVLRLIDAFRGIGMYVGSVVLTRWRDQHSAVMFKNRLESLGVRSRSSAITASGATNMSKPPARWCWSPHRGRAAARWPYV